MKRQSLFSPPARRRGSPFRRGLAVLAVLLIPPAVPHLLALRIPGPGVRPADVLFVLSGGEGRIAEGYRAWTAGAAGDLYILGAGGHTAPSRILPGAAALPASTVSRIHVEGWSENTLENAFSAKSVVSTRGFSSAILVTSDYHAPRAYLAFRKVLPPGVSLSVLSVPSDGGTKISSLWRRARRHFLEGWKYWGYRILLRWE